MTRFFRNNGLTITLLLLFAASILGHWFMGWHFENEELQRHGQGGVSLIQYAAEPQFLSTIFENWESEFLQMSAYVVLTAFLFQKGSAESSDPDGPPRDADLAHQAGKPGAPRLLRYGPLGRALYARSLGITLFLLFVASFALHWRYSAANAAAEAKVHGETPLTLGQYIWDSQLWFESFQNWQSEFLSTAVLVVLSIFLRQKESPESKPVAAPHRQTGA